MKYIKEFESLSSDGIYSISKIEFWLLKYYDEYNRIKEKESERFVYFIDAKEIRLPDHIEVKTVNEFFLHFYDTLIKVTELHKNENYFKSEMAIYNSIKNTPEEIKKWLVKNERLGADKYFMFSLDYFGDEDEMEKVIHLNVAFLEGKVKNIFIDRNDFKHTIEFTNAFNNTYWDLLEELNLKKLN